jgi:CheY-like chemotaxis protein
MRILVLEDQQVRIDSFRVGLAKHDVTYTDKAQEAIELIKRRNYDLIFLDNDLGDGNGEGLEVATYLQSRYKKSKRQPIIVIHSWNVVASNKINSKLPRAVQVPFNKQIFENFDLTFRFE